MDAIRKAGKHSFAKQAMLNAIIQKDHARRHETSEISEGNKSASREWQRNASTDSNIGMQPVKTKPTATGDDGRKGQMTKSKGTHNARDACSTHKESIVKPDASTSNGQSRRIHSSTAVETGREATRRVNIKASTAGRLSEGPTFVEDGNPLWEPVIIVAAHGRKPRTGVVDSTKKGRFTQTFLRFWFTRDLDQTYRWQCRACRKVVQNEPSA